MKNKGTYITLLLCVVIVIGFLIAKKKLDAWNRFKDAKETEQELIKKGGIQDGDIIFHTSLSRQSRAIQAATHSPYSHCGIIFKNADSFNVLEAVQPVKYTPLSEWMAKGAEGKFVIKRLKKAAQILTPPTLLKMKKCGESFIGKNYDLYFGWNDEKIYCSELVWKIYERGAGIKAGKLQLLKDFDLSSKSVKEIMQKRYGTHIPLSDTVISPVSIFNSELLENISAK